MPKSYLDSISQLDQLVKNENNTALAATREALISALTAANQVDDKAPLDGIELNKTFLALDKTIADAQLAEPALSLARLIVIRCLLPNTATPGFMHLIDHHLTLDIADEDASRYRAYVRVLINDMPELIDIKFAANKHEKLLAIRHMLKRRNTLFASSGTTHYIQNASKCDREFLQKLSTQYLLIEEHFAQIRKSPSIYTAEILQKVAKKFRDAINSIQNETHHIFFKFIIERTIEFIGTLSPIHCKSLSSYFKLLDGYYRLHETLIEMTTSCAENNIDPYTLKDYDATQVKLAFDHLFPQIEAYEEILKKQKDNHEEEFIPLLAAITLSYRASYLCELNTKETSQSSRFGKASKLIQSTFFPSLELLPIKKIHVYDYTLTAGLFTFIETHFFGRLSNDTQDLTYYRNRGQKAYDCLLELCEKTPDWELKLAIMKIILSSFSIEYQEELKLPNLEKNRASIVKLCNGIIKQINIFAFDIRKSCEKSADEILSKIVFIAVAKEKHAQQAIFEHFIRDYANKNKSDVTKYYLARSNAPVDLMQDRNHVLKVLTLLEASKKALSHVSFDDLFPDYINSFIKIHTEMAINQDPALFFPSHRTTCTQATNYLQNIFNRYSHWLLSAYESLLEHQNVFNLRLDSKECQLYQSICLSLEYLLSNLCAHHKIYYALTKDKNSNLIDLNHTKETASSSNSTAQLIPLLANDAIAVKFQRQIDILSDVRLALNQISEKKSLLAKEAQAKKEAKDTIAKNNAQQNALSKNKIKTKPPATIKNVVPTKISPKPVPAPAPLPPNDNQRIQLLIDKHQFNEATSLVITLLNKTGRSVEQHAEYLLRLADINFSKIKATHYEHNDQHNKDLSNVVNYFQDAINFCDMHLASENNNVENADLLYSIADFANQSIDEIHALLQQFEKNTFARAMTLCDKFQFSAAIPLLKSLYDNCNTSLSVILQLTNCYNNIGKPNQAVALLEQALKQNNPDVLLRIKLAEMYSITRDFNKADDAFAELKIIPIKHKFTYYKHHTKHLYYSDQHDKLRSHLIELEKASKKSIQLLFLLAFNYSRLGQHELADDYYAQLFAVSDNNINYQTNYCRLLIQQKKLTKARSLLVNIIDANPNYISARLLLADLESKCGNHQVALDHIAYVSHLSPDYLKIKTTEIFITLRMNNFDRADKLLTTLYHQNPDNWSCCRLYLQCCVRVDAKISASIASRFPSLGAKIIPNNPIPVVTTTTTTSTTTTTTANTVANGSIEHSPMPLSNIIIPPMPEPVMYEIMRPYSDIITEIRAAIFSRSLFPAMTHWLATGMLASIFPLFSSHEELISLAPHLYALAYECDHAPNLPLSDLVIHFFSSALGIMLYNQLTMMAIEETLLELPILHCLSEHEQINIGLQLQHKVILAQRQLNQVSTHGFGLFTATIIENNDKRYNATDTITSANR